jgi:hypothetical protein
MRMPMIQENGKGHVKDGHQEWGNEKETGFHGVDGSMDMEEYGALGYLGDTK